MTSVAPTRPALRYHGGKFRLRPWVIAHFPRHRVYTEGYGGAASVLLAKPRVYAEVLGDLDDEVTGFFRVLRDRSMAAELERLLRLTPFARAEFEAAYEPTDDPVERARRTVIKAFMGFGSNAVVTNKPRGMRTRASTWRPTTGFRANSNRSGTTPAHDWASYPDQIGRFTERLQGVVIETRPALDVIAQHDRCDCLHYVDPPYVTSTRGNTRKGYRFEMTDDEHRELAGLLRGVSGYVVISGYPSELYDFELYPDWPRVERRHLADGARERTEVLWLSPRTMAAIDRGLFGTL